MNRFARHLTALMLALTLGLHWSVLQSVAWMNMLVTYSAGSTFGEAVVKTFSGEHPCKLCIAVAEGKQAERDQKQLTSQVKADWLLTGGTILLIRPPSLSASIPLFRRLPALTSPPPKPPPRLA